MWKSGVAALLAAAVFTPSFAAGGDGFDAGMNTMWEVLWHQSGTPTRLVRWDQDMKVRVKGSMSGTWLAADTVEVLGRPSPSAKKSARGK